ncbi:hypothetical protein [Mesorhizobium sp. WSM2239]|uniref:GGDEF domain-containing protein n=1 Tax=Mesorhizobium sp. WSM2239 TaxID=3228852 RepID=A0AAU8D6J9_9HYPH
MSDALEQRLRQQAEGFAVHFADVDRFKQVNDAVLKAIAERLGSALE